MISSNKSQPLGTIGVFDSGVGGLTILQHLIQVLPGYDFDYFGDTARAPYGTRSPEVITQFTEQAVEFLFSQGAVMIILACNTSSAIALRALQEKYLRQRGIVDQKILGVIAPAVEHAVRTTRNRRIGVLGTSATIASKAYDHEITKRNPHCSVRGVACPLLVPLIEEGQQHTEAAKLICEQYMKELHDFDCDTVLLACTHYPFMLKTIQALLPTVTVLEQGPIVAESTVAYLHRHPEIDTQLSHQSRVRFFVSDDAARFREAGKRYFHGSMENVVRVNIDSHPFRQTLV